MFTVLVNLYSSEESDWYIGGADVLANVGHSLKKLCQKARKTPFKHVISVDVAYYVH